MSGENIIIIAVAIALVAVAIVRRRSQGAGVADGRQAGLVSVTSPGTAAPRRGGLLPLPGDVGLVAAREFRERVRGRVFRFGTLLILVAIAAAIVIPGLVGSRQNVQRVGVAGALSAPLRTAVAADGAGTGASVQLVPEPNPRTATAGLRAGQLDAAIIDGREVVVDKAITASPTSATAELAGAVARTVGTAEAFATAGLTAAQTAVIATARPLPVSSLQAAGPGTTQRATSLAGLFLVFIMLTQYNAWTLTGVLEEKSSRVVEVLLAAISPAKLLAGKVLGIGLTAFLQAGLIVAVALALAKQSRSDVLHGSTPGTIGATLLWLILGYALYSWAYAAAGSLADRQDQVQSLAFPLALPVMFGYITAFSAATSGSPSVLVHVLAYLPPTAPLTMPVLVSLGAVSWWEFLASVVISIGCTVAVARLAATVYQRAILRTGGRVRLREVLTV